MNLSNFKKHINPNIVERGYEYYLDNNVIEIYEEDKNSFKIFVEGTNEYEIEVDINDNGDIINSYCDCPYDFGPICKHEVAAYFKLFEVLSNDNPNKTINKKNNIEEVLNDLEKEELIDIILDFTTRDRSLREAIILEYSKVSDEEELKRCKELIDSIANKYGDRSGYIYYTEVPKFINEMEILHEKIRKVFEVDKNYLLALDIALLTMKEGVETFEYVDDSDEIEGFVQDIIEMINDICIEIRGLSEGQKEKAFYKLIEASKSKIFNDWNEYRIDLISISSEFSDCKVFRDKVINEIDRFLSNEEDDYINERLLLLKLELIEEYEEKEKIDIFIKDNIEFTSFRELYINRCFDENNYLKVIELALEGEKKDNNKEGLVLEWKKSRYKAYKMLRDVDEQINLAMDILINGDFDYYEELKNLTESDFNKYYNKIKSIIKASARGVDSYIFKKLIEEEQDEDEIIEIVRKSPNLVDRYKDILCKNYKEEVMSIYKKNIYRHANLASSRDQYKDVCKLIVNSKKVIGNDEVNKIIDELKITYKRKYAFIEELNNIR